MRPNVHITNTDDLPIRQLHTGSWQLRKRIAGGKRIEIALGTKNKAVAEERARKIIDAHVSDVVHSTWAKTVNDGAKYKGWLWRMHYNMHARAKKKGMHAKVSLDVLHQTALRSGGHCEVSGIRFYLGIGKRHPFQPSVDRIDSAKGYEMDNIRFVCLSVNMCMAQWGDDVFHTIAAATTARKLAELAKPAEKWVLDGAKIPSDDFEDAA